MYECININGIYYLFYRLFSFPHKEVMILLLVFIRKILKM